MAHRPSVLLSLLGSLLLLLLLPARTGHAQERLAPADLAPADLAPADLGAGQDAPKLVSGGAAQHTHTWDYEGPYFVMGASPAASMRIDGFSPAIRYAAELGLHWRRRETVVQVGAEGKIHQVLGRERPGGGLDGVLTVSRAHLYGRLGAGVATGIPLSRHGFDAPPTMGGLVGIGLQGGGRRVLGRIGVDYDVRIDTMGRVGQAVLLNLSLVFGF